MSTINHIYIVEPANSRRELGYVAAFVVILLVLTALRIHLLPETEQNLLLAPYQRLDNSLEDTGRTLYQTLLSSQQEIVELWEVSSEWPTVQQLDEEEIPPFAGDFMPGKLKEYQWKVYNRGPWVDYLGTNPAGDQKMPSVLLRLINLHTDFHPQPHPGIDYDPEQKTAVQIWIHSENRQRYVGMQLANHGWSWIVSQKDLQDYKPD